MSEIDELCMSVHPNNPDGSESTYAEETLDHVALERQMVSVRRIGFDTSTLNIIEKPSNGHELTIHGP